MLLRSPSGGYLHCFTANRASSAVFTSGTISPSAPLSKAFLNHPGLESGIRTSTKLSPAALSRWEMVRLVLAPWWRVRR